MNPHRDFDSLVEPYLADGLSPRERESFQDHLTDCVDCTTALADAQEFSTFLTESLGDLRPPAGFEDRLVDGMGWGKADDTGTGTSKPLPRWVLVAAAALLFIAIGAFASTGSLPDSAESQVASTDPLTMYGLTNGRFSGLQQLLGGNDPEVLKTTGAWIKDSGLEEYAPLTITDGEAATEPAEVRLKNQLGRVDLSRGRADVDADTEESLGITPGFDPFQVGAVLDAPIPLPRVEPADTPGPPRQDAPNQDPQERKIIRNATLELEVESFDTTYAAITDAVTENGGFVSSSSRQKLANGKIMGTVVVRVPQEGFSAVVLALAELGDLKNQSVSSQEVTKQYVDLSSRLRSKKVLEERLLRMLEEAEGELKDLLVVEKELGQVRSEIEQIQGELNYYDNLVSLSTITLNLRERDIGQPFEYVQTLESNIGVTVEDVETAYQSAQDIIAEHSGRILDAGMTRQGEEQATGTIVAAVDADAFPQVREELRRLGVVSTDTVTRKQQPRGGSGGTPSPDAPVIREEARISLQVSTPPTVVTLEGNVSVVADDPRAAFESARAASEASGGRLLGGGMTDHVDGSEGTLQILVDAARARALVNQLESLGEVEHSTVTEQQPPEDTGLRRERGRILLTVTSPARLVDRSEGIGAVFRGTISGSIKGILWSLEMLVVGIAYGGPWLLVLLVLAWIYRRTRPKKTVGATGTEA